MWFVPQVAVWGAAGLGEIEYLVFEEVNSSGAVYHGSIDISDTPQEIRFDQLADHRGNQLPSSLASPRVIPRSREASSAFIVGEETAESFKIARDPSTTEVVTTDLLILEMGD
jgi:hypothetical protein